MNWQEFSLHIDDIETIYSAFLTFIFYSFWKAGWGSLSSFISMGIWTASNYIMERISPIYLNLADPVACTEFLASLGVSGDPTSCQSVIRQLWFPTWVFFYFISILLIPKIHKRLHTGFSAMTKTICLTMLCLIVLQVARYLDRFVFNSEVLYDVYRWGVLSLNFGPAILGTLVILAFVFNNFDSVVDVIANKFLSVIDGFASAISKIFQGPRK
ncbi:hypothetical protein LZ645_01220 [Shewanella algae]|uniref:hypothetical protein n=1 Tax=Shewanella algae TaxID=38313 RepID=UPI001F3A38C1|nr:hypothetical protein [Shewanella algae]MCE9773566.1 hypothetical protein [Shewanella algae]